MTRCCVPNCSETATHQFPKDEKLKRKWLKAIRRVNFVPKIGSRLCRNHFQESDYIKISKYTGKHLLMLSYVSITDTIYELNKMILFYQINNKYIVVFIYRGGTSA